VLSSVKKFPDLFMIVNEKQRKFSFITRYFMTGSWIGENN